ncbi:CarboxypepD_reg-like domain protein [Parabacteroides distasonis]|uniref:STN domain-containing protein n=1 Tax=Parabacteroides distasonis TaxID=823 RepID=UPI001BA55922|nr:STN domain-containing protein [Parabacteroides distasonis]QUT52143.1 CarboxypepD_reg-like domain protein [Parabacteroides distasonis]
MKKDTKFGVRYGVPYFIARVMAISIFFLLANTGNLLAVTESFLHFDLSANETTLEQVFHELEKQSGYSIIYKSSEVNLKEVLSVDVREQPLETILNTVLKKQGLTYEIKDEHIIVYKAKVSNEVRAFVTQQSRKVSGTVKDVLGEPMIGVSVLEEGTQNGTVTDFNGNYVLELKNGKSVLVFSYIGYVSKKINVENLSVINTELEEDVQRLDDVVVVGYGTMRKKI